MKKKSVVFSFVVISVLYLAVLVWVDSNKDIGRLLPKLYETLPFLILLSFLSYFFRYIRWRWLFYRAGYQTPVIYGFFAYVAGFAFTATPGKVGELLRIRYFQPLGVPHYRVVAAFVFERMFDLVSVLLIASLAAMQFGIFLYAVIFVSVVVLAVIVLMKKTQWVSRLEAYFRLHKLSRPAILANVFRKGIRGVSSWNNPLDMFVAVALGLIAWGITSAAFVFLLDHLGVVVPVATAVAIYPLSMLAGAASLLPGGVGSAEAAIVVMLAVLDVPIDIAVLAAICIRLTTLWFAILIGFISMSYLEYRL